jgi:hypothetical protein
MTGFFAFLFVDLSQRIAYRNDLRAVKFNEVGIKFSSNEIHLTRNPGDRPGAPPQERSPTGNETSGVNYEVGNSCGKYQVSEQRIDYCSRSNLSQISGRHEYFSSRRERRIG